MLVKLLDQSALKLGWETDLREIGRLLTCPLRSLSALRLPSRPRALALSTLLLHAPSGRLLSARLLLELPALGPSVAAASARSLHLVRYRSAVLFVCDVRAKFCLNFDLVLL